MEFQIGTTKFAVKSAIKLLENNQLVEHSVKQATKEALRDVLTIAGVSGPIHQELQGLVQRSSARLDVVTGDASRSVQDTTALLRSDLGKLAAHADMEVHSTIRKWQQATPDAFSSAIAAAMGQWLDRNGERILREVSVARINKTEPAAKEMMDDFCYRFTKSQRAWNVLHNGAWSVEVLLSATDDELRNYLRSLKRCGEKTLNEILDAVSAYKASIAVEST